MAKKQAIVGIRPWRPLSKRNLEEILRDTEQDVPEGNYSPDDVYRLAREVEYWRARKNVQPLGGSDTGEEARG